MRGFTYSDGIRPVERAKREKQKTARNADASGRSYVTPEKPHEYRLSGARSVRFAHGGLRFFHRKSFFCQNPKAAGPDSEAGRVCYFNGDCHTNFAPQAMQNFPSAGLRTLQTGQINSGACVVSSAGGAEGGPDPAKDCRRFFFQLSMLRCITRPAKQARTN